MRRYPNLSALAFAMVFLAGVLVGWPKLATFSTQASQQNGQIQRLQHEMQELRSQQHALQGALAGEHSELEEQSQQLLRQKTRMEEQRVQAASLSPQNRQESLRHDILAPVFQVSGADSVGSAVLVHHDHDAKGSYYLALSCYHVLRDIVALDENVDPHTVPFDNIFNPIKSNSLTVTGWMLAENIDADLALLRINTDLDLGPVARLAPRERQQIVQAFTPVYTVGCPLGTSAQATHGEVTRNDWKVDDQPYWMVSSPAYFGNSGGGVFLEESHELIGVFSKIYTHGNYRPQVITHMGLAVPLNTIHDWLLEIGYERILSPSQNFALQIEEAHSSAAAE